MGANRFTGEVELTVDLVRRDDAGKERSEQKTYIFRLGTNDLIKLQADLGIEDDHEFLLFLAHIRSLKKMRQVMKAGLLRYQPSVDDDEAGDVIDALGRDAAPTIVRAFKWMFPEAKKGSGAVGKDDGSTGATSSPTPPDPGSDQTSAMS